MYKPKLPNSAWKTGNPPRPGWYMASDSRDTSVWRWWNGKNWSYPVRSDRDHHEAARRARKAAKARRQRSILWTDHWPVGARVARP